MNGVKGSSPWRRIACAIVCLTVVFVVVDSLRASGPQPTTSASHPRKSFRHPFHTTVLSSIDRALQVVPPQQQPAAAAAPSVHRIVRVVTRYCVTCHNEKLKTGGLVLATVDVDNVSADQRRGVGKSGAQASGARDASAWDASPRRGGLPEFRLAPGDVARSVRRGQPESRASRHAPPAQSHRVSERRPRPARSRGGCGGHSAERRFELWVRQHQRRRAVADAAGTLPGASQKISRLAVGTPVRAPARKRWCSRRI